MIETAITLRSPQIREAVLHRTLRMIRRPTIEFVAAPGAPAARRLACTVFLVAAIGCASSRSGALRSDLERYLQQMSTWAPVQAETARTLERILATEFVDEAEIRHQIADDRPRVLAHLERARAYSPATATVQELHRTYLAAWQQLLDGYASIELGFSSGDYTNLSRGRDDMTAWRDDLVRVARQLGELAEHEGVSVAPPKPQLT